MAPTVTIGPLVSVITFSVHANTDLVKERKWQELSDNDLETADGPAYFKSDLWKHLQFPCVKKWDGAKVAKNSLQTLQHYN